VTHSEGKREKGFACADGIGKGKRKDEFNDCYENSHGKRLPFLPKEEPRNRKILR